MRRMGMEVWLHYSWPQHYIQASEQLHAPPSLSQAKEPKVPVIQEPLLFSYPVRMLWRQISSPHRGMNIENRASSQPQYRLSYAGSFWKLGDIKKNNSKDIPVTRLGGL